MTRRSTQNKSLQSVASPQEGDVAKAGALKDEKTNTVLKRKKPGLQRGQSVRNMPKLSKKPALVSAIALAIRQRTLETPGQPYTYDDLYGKYGYTPQTLRKFQSIKDAMDEARAAAVAAKQAETADCDDAAVSEDELSKAQLREDNKLLNREVENYRLYFQRLALMYRKRGEPMPQVVAEAESLATGKPIKPSQVSTDAADTVAPIFRK